MTSKKPERLDSRLIDSEGTASIVNLVMPHVNDILRSGYQQGTGKFAEAIVSVVVGLQAISMAVSRRYVDEGAVESLLDASLDTAKGIMVPGPKDSEETIVKAAFVVPIQQES